MIRVLGSHVVIDLRGTSSKKVSRKDFDKSIDELCTALKKNTDDIKHFLDNYPDVYSKGGYQLTIRNK
ncbi:MULTISPECIES: hypothetical protein [Bacillales]|uniref:hypothetical protein n=1 Tax=Bacillales TaxID=1385 RepID=UPI001E4E4732|nr:hypothetical protein [Metabacillus sp. B2-18]UGB30962.1 hypothetical protein LPC09_25305 [Metabacillus sp. B2-18]